MSEVAETARTPETSFENESYLAWDVSTGRRSLFGTSILAMYPFDQILNIVRDPMNNNKTLREISRDLYSCNGIVTNTIDYCVALPTLSRVLVMSGESDVMKHRLKAKVEAVMCEIRDKEFIRDGLHNAFIDGVYFAYFETAKRPLSKAKSLNDAAVQAIDEINEMQEINAAIIWLDPDYTRIIGIKNGSYVLAFDLSYFDTQTEDRESRLRRYPEEIRKGYASYKNGNTQQWLVLDNTKTIAVKFRAKKSEPWGRPLVLAAIDDILYDDGMKKAKRKAADESNSRIYYQTFPEGKNKGEAALSKTQQEKQHATVRDGITRKTTNGATVFFSVAAGTKIEALKPDVDILKTDNDTTTKNNISTAMGFAGSLLSGEGTSSFSAQANNLQLVTAEVFETIELLVYELNKVLNANVIQNRRYRVDVQYLPITYTNRKEFAGMAKELYLQGKGPLSLWAAAVGVSPEAFFGMMDEELENDVENRYPVHKTSYTMSADDSGSDTGGRPVDEDTQNPETLRQRTNGANDAPRPSTT